MDLVTLFLYLVGIFFIIKSLHYILVWVKLMRGHQQVPHHKWINPHKIPEKFTPVWVEADQELSALGFQYAYAKVTTITIQDIFSYVYVHSELPIFANVSPTLLSSGTRSYDVTFTSIFENGELVITTDCLNSIELPPSDNIHYQALFLGDLNKQWQAHLDSVNQLKVSKPISPIYPSVDEHLAVENNCEQSCFSHRINQGLIVALSPTQVWRYSAVGAIKLLRPLFKASKQLSAATKANAVKILASPIKATTSQETSANAQLIASVTAFERALDDESRRQSWGWATKTILFLVSVLATAVTFGLTFSWKTVPIFLGVLFIHELGHLLGMKLFGYKDTQILFLPFLGAVTIGEKEEVTPMQKLVIYLLGPVPGVIGGFICAYIYVITGQNIWYEIALMAIIINYINLLPILPLDGGRVVEAIFFSRFPRAQAVVYIVNTCILVGVYFLLNDKILLFLAVIFALSLPSQWKFGKAAKEVSKILPPNHNRTNRLEAIFTVLNTQPQFLKQALPEKHTLAKQLFSHFSNVVPTFKTTLVGGFIYLLMLGLPIGGVIGWAAVNWWAIYSPNTFFNSRNQTVEEPKKEIPWEEKIKQAKTVDERWEILMDAARNQYSYDENEEANKEANNKSKEYYLQALDVAKTFPPPDLRYINNLMILAGSLPKEESQSYYQQAFEYAEKHSSLNSIKIAEILERLSGVEFLDTKQKIKYLEKALEIRTALLANNPNVASKAKDDENFDENVDFSMVVSNQIYLSSLYEENQEIDKAEEILKKALSLCKSNKVLEYKILNIAEILSDFYLRTEKISLVKQILSENLAQQKQLRLENKETPFNSLLEESNLTSHLAWVYVIEKDLNTANKLFEEALKLKLEHIAQQNKSWVNWLISKMSSSDISFITLNNLLDLCYIQLEQGKVEEAKTTFKKVKSTVLSIKGQTLENYHLVLTRNAKYQANIIIQNFSSKKTNPIDEEIDSEDLESYQNPSDVDFSDPLIEKAKQTDRSFLRTLAHKEVFDKLK